jgi:TRAP-type C4-dicarboxylate transport system substrate-binding protein
MKLRHVLAASLFAAFASTASAQELKLASGWPTTQGAHGAAEVFKTYVEANSDLTISIFHSGSLLAFGEIPGGLRDGVADLGSILPPYYPSEFPESNLAANLSMLTNVGKKVNSAGAAMAGATMEYILGSQDALDNYKRQNEVYLGTLSSATYDLLCRDPIRTVAELKGKKMRVGQANFGRFVESFGGVQVAIPANEMYEAMAQGVVDCAVLAISDLKGYQMADVVKNVMVGIPGGVFSGAEPFNINREVWQTLTVDQRKVLLQAAANGVAEATYRLYTQAKDVKGEAPSMGVEVIEPSEEMVKATDDFIKGDIPVISAQFTNDFGVQNVDKKIADVTALIDKWKGLTENWDGTSEALAKIYWDEVLSKVDPAAYGID